MKKIYLVRHAHIETEGCFIGKSDKNLSELGKTQAEKLQEELEKYSFQYIALSPLKRARETVERLLCAEKNYYIDERLREIDLGDWEGEKRQEIKRQYPDLWEARGKNIANIAPPKGENFSELSARVLPAFFELFEKTEEGSMSLLVAHQAVNRVILASVYKIPLAQALTIEQEYASITILIF